MHTLRHTTLKNSHMHAFHKTTRSSSAEPTFDVDPVSLERRYKLLQWTLHPDKAVTRTPEERAFSAGHAAALNQAYGVLRAPLARANYLLRLKGGGAAGGAGAGGAPGHGADTAGAGGGHHGGGGGGADEGAFGEGTIADPELLMEVMEARERVEASADAAELAALRESARARQRGVEAELSAAFKAGDYAEAAALVARLTYYVRLEEAITAKL